MVYQDLGKHDQAIEDFAEAIDIDPDCATAMYYMAKSKLKNGQVS